MTTFKLNSFSEYVSPVDRANREARRLRARHWATLRRASTHYGTRDMVARAFLTLALLVLGMVAAGCDDGPEYIYVPVPTECEECGERDCKRPHLQSPGATVTDTQLRYTRALALGTPAPQADEHAPWCPRLPGCMGGCWGNGSVPRDTTGRANAKLRMNDPFPTVFWPFVGRGY